MNDLTPTDEEYYVDRTPAEEQELRADFARAYQLRAEAGRVGSLNEYSERIDQADAIAHRWRNGEDRHLARVWFGIEGAAEAWERYPAAMHRQLTESADPSFIETAGGRSFLQARDLTGNGSWAPSPTMPGEAPPDMAPATRPSRSQARETTGHGRWPDTTTTSTDREGAEPMNDTTHRETIPTDDEVLAALPRSIAAGAFEVFDPEKAARELTAESETESWTEQKMRADFMHAQSFVSRDPEDYDSADALDYSEYANPWMSGDEKWMNEWIYLQSATQRWREDPEFAAGLNIESGGDDALTPIQLRSEQQARYIAEHGIERAESGLLTSHYVTRVEHRDHGPSPLANYLPGNALAAHAANFERDGVER